MSLRRCLGDRTLRLLGGGLEWPVCSGAHSGRGGGLSRSDRLDAWRAAVGIGGSPSGRWCLQCTADRLPLGLVICRDYLRAHAGIGIVAGYATLATRHYVGGRTATGIRLFWGGVVCQLASMSRAAKVIGQPLHVVPGNIG